MRRLQHKTLRRTEHEPLLGRFLLADPRVGLFDDSLFYLFLRGRRRHADGRDLGGSQPGQKVPNSLRTGIHHDGGHLDHRRICGCLHDGLGGRDRRDGVHRSGPDDRHGARKRSHGHRLQDKSHQRELYHGTTPGHDRKPVRPGLRRDGRQRRAHAVGHAGGTQHLFRRPDGVAWMVPLCHLWRHWHRIDAAGPHPGLCQPAPPHGRDGVRRGAKVVAGTGQRTGRDWGAHQDRARCQSRHGQRRWGRWLF
mmetsp:Transcript_14749/g.41106  ORF Transcript_14749/g.41106 Transcript_14749/m.41106 type:complete len:251 (-) Transcript_14749:1043-1795(-)